MAQSETIQRILHFFRFTKFSDFVCERIDKSNMRTAVPITLYTLIMERFMYNRTVILWGLIPRNVYIGSFVVLALLSVQLLIVSLLYLSGRFRNHKAAVISLYLYYFGCVVIGQTIAVIDYAIGKQVILFLPMVSWLFALFLINPFSSICFAVISFRIIPEYMNNGIGMSNYVNKILLIFAVMMIVISIVRWYSQLFAAEAEEQLNEVNRRLEEISMKDELTGVKNRHALHIDFPEFKERKMIVVMSDIDDFKYYNDSFGHETGDLVLRHMADTLSKIYGRHSVYRFGGDEFLLVLPDWDEADLMASNREWKARFRVYECEGNTLHLASTSGYAIGAVSNEEQLSQMISLADTMLYEGKMTKKGGISGAIYDPNNRGEAADLKTIESNLRSGEVDVLTKLPNMMYFRSKADLTADLLRSSGKKPVLAFLNIENFKDFNRKYGFEAGDVMLKRLAELLSKTFDNDLVCRFADDHFAIITKRDQVEEKLEHVGEVFLEAVTDNRISLAAGLYELSDGSVDVSLACDCARQAMYGDHRGICGWYDDEMRRQLELRQYISDHLDEALAGGWIENVYQPIIRSVNRFICGMEVLPRWNDPVHGILSPELYVPVLEESHLITMHDMHVIKQAVNDFRRYQEKGLVTTPVVINLSFIDLDQDDIVRQILSMSEGIDRSSIHFDLSASSLRHMNPHIKETLNELKGYGYQIWMDGFGRENSTVDILYNNLIHGIKIDIRSLHDAHGTGIETSFVHHIISMCKDMNIATLALGVESEEEAKYLTECGCEYMQGFWFSTNLTFEECCSEMFLNGFVMEPKEKEPYYQAMSRVDLAKPARLDYDQDIEIITEDLPAAICEYRDGRFTTCISNPSFRSFLKTRQIDSIEQYDMIMNKRDYYLYERLENMCREALASRKWVTVDIGKNGQSCTCSFHVISQDGPDVFSIIGVVVNMDVYRQNV